MKCCFTIPMWKIQMREVQRNIPTTDKLRNWLLAPNLESHSESESHITAYSPVFWLYNLWDIRGIEGCHKKRVVLAGFLVVIYQTIWLASILACYLGPLASCQNVWHHANSNWPDPHQSWIGFRSWSTTMSNMVSIGPTVMAWLT